MFSGGCFFGVVAAEYRARPGAVHDAISEQLRRRGEFIAESVRRAVAAHELPHDTGVAQLAFELTALLDAANAESVFRNSPTPYAGARARFDRLLTPRNLR